MPKPIWHRSFEPGVMRYFYIREEDTYLGCAFSIGFMYDKINQQFEYAVAFCSPKDRFSKKKAHLILEGRMGAGRSIKVASDTDLKYGEAITRILNSYNAESWREMFHMPSWAREEIEDYLCCLDETECDACTLDLTDDGAGD